MIREGQKTMRCPLCGGKVDLEQQFCVSCGTPLNFSHSSREHPPTSPRVSPADPSMPSHSFPPEFTSQSSLRERSTSLIRIILNYVISLIVFVLCTGLLFNMGLVGDVGGVIAFVTAAAVAGIVGGFVTTQHIPLKVVASIVLSIVGISILVSFLAFQGATQESSPYSMFGLAMFLVVVIFFTVILLVIFTIHAGFSYLGAKMRK